MSKLTSSPDFGNLKTWEDLRRWVTIWAKDVEAQVNGGLEFDSNIRSRLLTVTFGSANTDVSAVHGLGRTPVGYFLVGSNVATVVYDGSVSNSSTTVTLRVSVAATCRIMIF